MKFNIMSLAAAAAMALGLGACHDDCQIRDAENAEGTLSFTSMTVDVSVAENVMRNAPARHDEGSRAAVDVSGFLVSITNSAGELVEQWPYAEMPEIITLKVGTGYTVDVRSHEVQKAEWDHPYYHGTKTFDITEGQVTHIGEVLCKFESIKVTIKFDDELLAKLGDDANVNVLANDEGSHDFKPGETRSGYFAAVDGSSTLVATFTGTVAGHAERIQRTLVDVAAGQHRIITFKIKGNNQEPDPETGNIDPSGITVDMDVENEDLNGNVTVEDDPTHPDNPWKPNPGPEPGPGPDEPGPDNPGQPTITFDCGQIDPEGVNKASEFGTEEEGKTPAVVLIHSDKPIAKLEVMIDSESLTPELLEGVNLASKFDLANPGDLATGLNDLGLPNGADVLGKNDVTFDISGFMTLLCIYPDAISKFIITLTDNAGATASQTLTFSTYN